LAGSSSRPSARSSSSRDLMRVCVSLTQRNATP
jgi:hypothetical protein